MVVTTTPLAPTMAPWFKTFPGEGVGEVGAVTNVREAVEVVGVGAGAVDTVCDELVKVGRMACWSNSSPGRISGGSEEERRLVRRKT